MASQKNHGAMPPDEAANNLERRMARISGASTWSKPSKTSAPRSTPTSMQSQPSTSGLQRQPTKLSSAHRPASQTGKQTDIQHTSQKLTHKYKQTTTSQHSTFTPTNRSQHSTRKQTDYSQQNTNEWTDTQHSSQKQKTYRGQEEPAASRRPPVAKPLPTSTSSLAKIMERLE